MASYTRAQVAALIDHTLLKPEATEADVVALLTEAAELGVYAVCVSPSMVSAAAQAPGAPVVASVSGFPSGKHLSEIKASEAARAVADGAREVDMVIDIGAACSGELDVVRADVAAVRDAVPDAVLKVIVESAVLLECGHGGICYECAQKCARKRPPLCQMCRGRITQIVQLAGTEQDVDGEVVVATSPAM